jgi:transposase
MVRQRTEHIHSLQSMIERHTARRLNGNEVKKLYSEDLEEMFEHEYSSLAANADSCTIKFLTEQIKQIEKAVLEKVKVREPFKRLLTVPGIGEILALTIMLEVGDIGRFPKVGNFTSYARCVPSGRITNGKKKGEGNRKNGNHYLGWAFVEACNFARRFYPKFRSYHQRKASKSHPFVATKAICNKLARICYYVMRDGVCFREEAIFC